ncbi:MAG: ferredoxin [Candidatus Omnitrophota bacterium]
MAVITVDESLCTGCGLCSSTCPEVFEVDDSNIARVKDASADCDLNEVAASCPVEAIKVTE